MSMTPSAWDVSTYLDGQCVDTQTVKAATDLVANDYVVFKTSATLAPLRAPS